MATKTAFTVLPGDRKKECPAPNEVICDDGDGLDNGNGGDDGGCPPVQPCFKKRLLILDFDQTITDGSTIGAVQSLLHKYDLCIVKLKNFSNHIEGINQTFKLLHKQKGLRTCNVMLEAVLNVKPVPGIIPMIRSIKQLESDLVIISDGVDIFINAWLQKYKLNKCFNDIYSLTAEFDAKGLGKVKPVPKTQHCQYCRGTLCKGQILQDHIKKQCKAGIFYEHIFYVADGFNDYCPIQKLQKQNYAFLREEYCLDKYLTKCKHAAVKCNVKKWKHGIVLMEFMLQIVKLDLDLSYIKHYFGTSSLLPQCKNVLSDYYRSWMCECECSCCPCPKRGKPKVQEVNTDC